MLLVSLSITQSCAALYLFFHILHLLNAQQIINYKYVAIV